MKRSLRHVVFCIIPLFIVACESVPDEARVLEKSRQVEPAWLKSGIGLKPSPDGIDYVLLKDRVLDLPLGLVQTESSILHNLKFNMFQLIISHIDVSVLSPQSARDLRENIRKVMDAKLTKENIKDFYFDKVSVPMADNVLIPEYYRVYSYAHVESSQRASIASEVKSFIKSYPSEDLRSQINSVSQF